MAVFLGIALFFVLMWALSLQNEVHSFAIELSRIRLQRTEILNSSALEIETLKGKLAAERESSKQCSRQLMEAWVSAEQCARELQEARQRLSELE